MAVGNHHALIVVNRDAQRVERGVSGKELNEIDRLLHIGTFLVSLDHRVVHIHQAILKIVLQALLLMYDKVCDCYAYDKP